MKNEVSLALHAYWRRCRRDSAVRAGGIRAAELAPILPSLFLLDIDLSAAPHFRFCGAAVATRYGRDLAGESFLALWNAEDQTALQRDLRAVALHSTGLVAGVMTETLGGGFTAFEMLFLPLAGENGTAGAIGSMARVGGHEELNRIRARIVAQWLRSVRFLPAAEQDGESALPAQASAPCDHAAGAPRRYRHLTVVTGGR